MCGACSVEREADLHELRALECSSSAAVYGAIAAHMGEGTGEGVEALAEGYRGAGKGHEFRAEELRYDARGGMTRAQAAGQVIDVLTEIMEAGAVKPVAWSRDDMAEVQGETWDEPRKGDG